MWLRDDCSPPEAGEQQSVKGEGGGNRKGKKEERGKKCFGSNPDLGRVDV